MAKITYNTKKQRVNTPATTEEIFSFNDANEIKASVNYLYDNPSTPDLNGLIRDINQSGQTQSASINIDGTALIKGKSQMSGDDALSAIQAGALTLVDGDTYTNLYGGNLLVNSSFGSINLNAGGMQTVSAAGSITFNAGVIASNTPDGRLFSLLGGVVNVGRNGAERTIEISDNAIGNYNVKFPDKNGQLATLDDIPAAVDISGLAPKASPAFTGVPTAPMAAQLSNDDTIVTSKWVWDHDVLNNISKFGQQEQTGWLTLKNWLTFKKINSWANSTNAGNLSYSDTHRWVFMSSSDSTKNIGFEILPSETKTVIRLILPVTGGTIARLEDMPNAANFAKVNDYNVFTYNNTFEGYSTFQGGTFNGNLNVNSGKRTMLGGGVDVYQDISVYGGIGKIVMNAEYTEQAHSITIPAKTGTFALLSDIPTPADTSLFLKNFDDGTNKFQIDVVEGLYLKGANGTMIMNRDAVTLYPSTGGNVTMSNTGFGFTRGDNISFYLNENRLLLQPAWNKSAIIKIDDAATGHEEYTLPINGGTLAVTEKINYLTAPDGTKWYIENDGTLSNHLAG